MLEAFIVFVKFLTKSNVSRKISSQNKFQRAPITNYSTNTLNTESVIISKYSTSARGIVLLNLKHLTLFKCQSMLTLPS